jgi:hypothetical protein
MCIFSSNVEAVSKTEIFARKSAIDKQFLVYRMDYEANQELAMILPLPTPKASPEDAVRFIDLSGYPGFFKDMKDGFEFFDSDSGSRGLSRGMSKSILAVKQVGSFEASFVPSLQDFDRLDPRFCIPENTWHSLPQYQDYGFAVFKLKPGNFASHPMAFEFPTRLQSTLFFPTVHIHDGQVEPLADFDHALYLQSQNPIAISRWKVSKFWNEAEVLAEDFVETNKTEGIVDGKMVVCRQLIKGAYPNIDTLVKVG